MSHNLKDKRNLLYGRFAKSRHYTQSLWLKEQFGAIDKEMAESTPDLGMVADALDRIERVLDLLGD